MKIGIIGAGNIARTLAATMNRMDNAELYAIAARDLKRAQAFAKDFNVKKAYGSYEEMLNDPEVELVYIATPHSHHFEHMRMCIEHGKNVLCEKAFTWHGDEAEEIKRLANEKKVYVAEAIWTRYMPSRKIINDLLAQKPVGEISMVTCNLSYDIDKNERIIEPSLAGGALLDIGVYGLNFIVMHFGKDIDHIDSSMVKAPTGVDGRESITLVYKNGLMANTTHSIYGRSDRLGILTGETGYIVIKNINNPSEINIYDTEDKLVKHIEVPSQISGYEYEIDEAIKSIEAGKIESTSMPLEESVYMMRMMDDISKVW